MMASPDSRRKRTRALSRAALRLCLLLAAWKATAADLPAAPGPAGAGADGQVRKLNGQHLTLWTDAPSQPEVDELPAVFDRAFLAWCRYFHVDPAKHANWHVTGCLIQVPDRFRQAGLLPADMPPFRNGYSLGEKLWLYEQDNPYYRRHLLLHEGTHSFMALLVGGNGPPWYSEGLAELLATHRWDGRQLTLNYFPADVAEVPRLGRIKIVQDGFAAGNPLSLSRVMAYDARAHLQNEPYGWCWAAAAFLDGHPRYRQTFRLFPELVSREDFNRRARQAYGERWPEVCDEWQVFVANLEHGYDFDRMAIEFSPGTPLGGASPQVEVAADRGWQSSRLRLEAGRKYRLAAKGRYQVAREPRVWWCEPGGVTIDYYHGQPLGVLLAAVRPDEADGNAATPLVAPRVVGLGTTLAPAESGTLYLRINESAARLADNSGTLTATVREIDK